MYVETNVNGYFLFNACYNLGVVQSLYALQMPLLLSLTFTVHLILSKNLIPLGIAIMLDARCVLDSVDINTKCVILICNPLSSFLYI